MQMDRFGSLIMIGFFALLWYVPFVSNVFWTLVFRFAQWIGIPLLLAVQGLNLFQFWRK